jgi:hypothetical protein
MSANISSICLIRAVAAYKPAKGEEEDHSLLKDYLAERASEQALWDDSAQKTSRSSRDQ